VFQDAGEPGAQGGPVRVARAALERGRQRLLYDVFRSSPVAQLEQRIAQEIAAVLLDPGEVGMAAESGSSAAIGY
jgi:hypothetical protein